MTKRHYSNGEITVLWQPEKCMHSGICFRGLPKAFDPRRRPWVELSHATTAELVAQVKDCPSGALSLVEGGGSAEEAGTDENEVPTFIELAPSGPLLLKGKLVLRLPDGTEQTMDKCALCRCGNSKKKPFCDGTHRTSGFTG